MFRPIHVSTAGLRTGAHLPAVRLGLGLGATGRQAAKRGGGFPRSTLNAPSSIPVVVAGRPAPRRQLYNGQYDYSLAVSRRPVTHAECLEWALIPPQSSPLSSLGRRKASDFLADVAAEGTVTKDFLASRFNGIATQAKTKTTELMAKLKQPSLFLPAVIRDSKAWHKTVEAVEHYYTGFKLLFVDMSVASKLLARHIDGEVLTRRERRQLMRTTTDAFRLVPFMVFVIVPFMEFLLPVALKLFPNMLPSTFDDQAQREQRKLQQLKIKVEVAKFLQDTVEEMVKSGPKKLLFADLLGPDAHATSATPSTALKEFADFIARVRNGDATITNQEILRFSRVFEDELTLDNLARPQLSAICQSLGVPSYGTSGVLRFQLRLRLRQLKADDHMIMANGGVGALTVAELQTACQERGMRAIGVALPRLRQQLEEWLELNLKEGVPASMLVLSHALDTSHSGDGQAMRETLGSLNDKLVAEAELLLAQATGQPINHKKKLELVAQEQKMIEQERQEELNQLKITAATSPCAPPSPKQTTRPDAGPAAATISPQEVASLADAMTILAMESAPVPASDKAPLVGNRDTINITPDMDVHSAGTVPVAAKASDRSLPMRLEKQVVRLVEDLEKDLVRLEKSTQSPFSTPSAVKSEPFFVPPAHHPIERDPTQGILALEQIINTAASVISSSGPSSPKETHVFFDEEGAEEVVRAKIAEFAKVLDLDGDGYVSVDEIKTVFEYLQNEGCAVTPTDVARLVELLHVETEITSGALGVESQRTN
eukprot:comp23697_c0_seq1/m.40702 comp23697_c0_seq1/g.40702  ORF comp23697_c0_seq1/g.40702 comp23697_c0_seq1/m.40702 type:complete len:772 (-) comp23697_c0_seq1:671-2986(-)